MIWQLNYNHTSIIKPHRTIKHLQYLFHKHSKTQRELLTFVSQTHTGVMMSMKAIIWVLSSQGTEMVGGGAIAEFFFLPCICRCQWPRYIGISLSIDSSRRSESLLSPHRFLSWVLINFSLENDRSTEAVVTGIVAYVFRSKVRQGKLIPHHCLLGTLAQLSHCWGEEHEGGHGTGKLLFCFLLRYPLQISVPLEYSS